MKKIKYKRILLKISGEFLKSAAEGSINAVFIDDLIKQIQLLTKLGVQIGLVVGGGNLFRGSNLEKLGMRRTISDQIGMLSTVINGLSIYELMFKRHMQARIFASTTLAGVCERYRLDKVNKSFQSGAVVIFCFGLGIPLFTTDSSACVHGVEIQADIFLKGTKVNGVYSGDPRSNPSATLYQTLTYDDVLNKKLQVMDYTSLVLARENKLPILVFNMSDPKILYNIVTGKHPVGTLITE
ncbi:UMP kinase [Buchnera aphidicola]|uniref:UMP kinase n=1 Tax=Buchnera aphidicola TaxID=9 RepID=UPI00094C38FA|nr:UMP kinase [Buchnera aphidicola]